MRMDGIDKESIQNVVLISFDSLRSDYVTKLNPNDAPNFCLLRDRGVLFKNTIVQAPFTVPSHVSMLTGLYPAATGVRDMHHRIPSGIPTLFTILKKAGFRTISSSPTWILTNRGFQDIDERIPFRMRNFGKTISNQKTERFFAFLHYWDIHTPYQTRLPVRGASDVLLDILRPADRLKDIRFLSSFLEALWLSRIKRIRQMMQDDIDKILPALKRGYIRSVIKADRFLGGVLKTLKKAGVLDKTLVVVTSDHGDSFNEHNEIERAVGGRYEHGQFLYENIIRVPLIFYWAQKKWSNIFDFQAQQIDILPTILDAVGIENDANIHGISLLSQILSGNEEQEDRFAFSEVVRDSLKIELRCVRSMTTKLIRDYINDFYELYDLRSDPEERNNLWPADGCGEKKRLMEELQIFASIESGIKASYSQGEKQHIESALRQLGYMD